MPNVGRMLVICALLLGWSGVVEAKMDRPTWTVQPGDALSLIAERFKVTVDELKTWNDLDGDMIRIGQTLFVGPQYIATTNVMKSPSDVPPDQGSIYTTSSFDDAEYDEIDWSLPFEYDDLHATTPTKTSSPQIASAKIPSLPRTVPTPAPATAKRATKTAKPTTYRIRRGDTLTSIATRHGVTIRNIINANPGIKPDRIFPGQTIAISEPRPEVRYVVERGDTIASIAARHGTTPRQLYAWNPRVRRGAIRPNTTIRLLTNERVSDSESYGAANLGRLRHGVRLPRHKGYLIRAPERSWGTEETIRWIVEGFDAVAKKFRRNKRVRVHDISDRDGGRLRDHKSHQSGRDVDISYYQTKCANNLCPFDTFRTRKLDVQRQWTLLHHWLKNGQAELIFIDYRLQAPLYRHAKRRGATKAQLSKWFQYPRGKRVPTGVIRHFRNHRDHLHARFVCPYSDRSCR